MLTSLPVCFITTFERYLTSCHMNSSPVNAGAEFSILLQLTPDDFTSYEENIWKIGFVLA